MGSVSCKNKTVEPINFIIYDSANSKSDPTPNIIYPNMTFVSNKISVPHKINAYNQNGLLINCIIFPYARLILKKCGNDYHFITKSKYRKEMLYRNKNFHIPTRLKINSTNIKYRLTIKCAKRINPHTIYNMTMRHIYSMSEWEILCEKLNDLFWLNSAPRFFPCNESIRISNTISLISEENDFLIEKNAYWSIRAYKIRSYQNNTSYGWILKLLVQK